MPRKTHVLFTLDKKKRFRLSCDDLQWILERGNPKHSRPGKDSGYRGFSFIAGPKVTLRRCIREAHIVLTPETEALVDALPDSFFEFRDMVRASGIAEFRRWLHERAGLPPATPEAA